MKLAAVSAPMRLPGSIGGGDTARRRRRFRTPGPPPLPILALALLAAGPVQATEWLHSLSLDRGSSALASPAGGTTFFLRFGGQSYAPARVVGPDGREVRVHVGPPILVAPFEQLWIEPWDLPPAGAGLRFEKPPVRDGFWDQLITADPGAIGPLPPYPVEETGRFGAALPAAVRRLDLRPDEIDRQQASLTDPIISSGVAREIPWAELEAQAYPLDFQKVLLASPNDSRPAFAYQNGQWFTTWSSRDLPAGAMEDHWFAPALLISGRLVRPAPLSAHTAFVRTRAGVTVPLWTLEWTHEDITVRQELFSHEPGGRGPPRVFVRFQLVNAPPDARVAIGAGRRPSAHYWDAAGGTAAAAGPVTPCADW